MICILTDMLPTDKRNLIQKVTTIKMKPEHWPSCSLHPPQSPETNKIFLTGGSNKNQIISTDEKLLFDYTAHSFVQNFDNYASFL